MIFVIGIGIWVWWWHQDAKLGVTTVKDLIDRHGRTLLRKKLQSAHHDDYGNIVWDDWMREVRYFIAKSPFEKGING